MISRSALSSTCTAGAEPSLPIAIAQALSRIERGVEPGLRKKHVGTAALGCPAGQGPAGSSRDIAANSTLEAQTLEQERSFAPRTDEVGCPYIRTEKRPALEPAPAVEYSLCTFLYTYRPRWLFSFGELCFFGGGLDLCGCAFDEFPLDFGGLDDLVLLS
jgi:hypothetical protein